MQALEQLLQPSPGLEHPCVVFCSARKANSRSQQRKPRVEVARIIPIQGRRKAPARAVNRPRRRPTVRASVARVAAVVRSSGLSRAALRWALSLADPWQDAAIGVNVPMATGHSQKVRGFIRGTGAIGDRGLGFVLVAPSVANDSVCLFYTTAEYPFPTEIVPLGGIDALSVGVVAAKCTNLPYSSVPLVIEDDDSTGVVARIAAVGLSVVYTGTNLNMSGAAYSVRSPQHIPVQTSDANSAVDLAYLGSHAHCMRTAFTRKPVRITDHAYVVTECEMGVHNRWDAQDNERAKLNVLYPFCRMARTYTDQLTNEFFYRDPISGTTTGSATSLIAVTGVPGSTFDFHYVLHAEYGGIKTAALASRNAADVQGVHAVLQAANESHYKRQSSSGSPWSVMKDSLKEGEKDLVRVAIPEAESAVAGLVRLV